MPTVRMELKNSCVCVWLCARVHSATLILHADNGFSALADTDPLDRHIQIALDEPDVVLGLGRQLPEIAHILRAL